MVHREVCYRDVEVPSKLFIDLFESIIAGEGINVVFENLSIEHGLTRKEFCEEVPTVLILGAENRSFKDDFWVHEGVEVNIGPCADTSCNEGAH